MVKYTWLVSVACWLVVTTAAAQQSDTPAAASGLRAEASAQAGMFLPETVAARTDSQHAFARAIGGYDFARRSSLLEGVGEVTVYGPISVRLGAMFSERPGTLRPTAGLRVAALSQAHFGLDLSLGAFYKPEGFTEAEGEVELLVAAGRRFGRLGTFANLVYGQDPEGAERDGELRLAALYEVTQALQAGIDGRLRLDLGSAAGARRASSEAEYDLVVGPTLSHTFGAIAAIGQLGLSAVGQQRAARLGVIGLLGFAGSL